MPLDSAWFQARADELRAEEEATQREIAQAETADEREKLRAELDELRTSHAEVMEELRQLRGSGGPPPPPPDPSPNPEGDPDPDPAKLYRPGRKHGQLYQEEDGGPGVIWQGDDEPDRVEVDEEGNDV